MAYKLLADITVLVHFAFIVFVVGGGFLCCWRFRLIYFHMPAVAWGAVVEYFGWICPLTYLEDWLRFKAGVDQLKTGFVDRYIMPIVYPSGMTRQTQSIIAATLLLLNVGIWLIAWYRFARRTG